MIGLRPYKVVSTTKKSVSTRNALKPTQSEKSYIRIYLFILKAVLLSPKDESIAFLWCNTIV